MKIFNIFKRKKEIRKANWNDITLEKFIKIQDLLNEQDEYTEPNLRELIYGVDTSNMTIAEATKYDISFLAEQINYKNIKLKEKYKLNGRKYCSNINLTKVTTAQFIDYTNYVREEDKDFSKILSVFVIPEGHSYNDGYDMREVQKDLLQLDIATVYSMSFFMMRMLQAFAIIFQSSFQEEVKKMNLNQTKKEQLEKSLKEVMTSVYSLF